MCVATCRRAGLLAVVLLLAAPLGVAEAGDVAPVESEELPPAVELAPLDEATALALSQALSFDPSSYSSAAAKALKAPSLPTATKLDVSGTDKPDGSSSIAFKQPLPTADYDTKLGLDLNTAATPPLTYEFDKPLPGARSGGNNGAAWASVGVDNLASLDARVDPSKDQTRLGGTLQRKVPIGSDVSLTLHNRYAVDDTYGAGAPTAPMGIPVMTLPQQTGGAGVPVWSNDRGVKLDIASTGTSLSAGLASASNGPNTHHTLSADQQVYGPLHVTTSVTDLGETDASKSITAKLKLNW